jgi:orotate phosphoribosyltransferase
MTLDTFLADLATRPEWAHAAPLTATSRASNGDTPLHAAIYANERQAARALINAGADVNAAGEDDYTPLHAAIAQADAPLVRLLTERGGSWDPVNKFACSVREAARRSDDPGMKALFEQEQLVSTLPGRIGHFRLESGHHSDLWLELEVLCAMPEFVRQRAATLATRLAPHDVEVVCGPLVEGAYVALLVALELGADFVYCNRIEGETGDDGLFPVKYRLPPALRGRVKGRRVAVVNDVVSAGSAVRGALADLQACEANVVAIGTLAVLGNSMPGFAQEKRLAFESLAEFPHNLWSAAECPLCRSGVPLTTDPAADR